QSLGCWPPRLFGDPIGHLLGELEPVIPYPVGDSESSIDFLGSVREKLEGLRRTAEQQGINSLQKLYMKGDCEGAVKLFRNQSTTSGEARQIVYWSLLGSANALFDSARTADAKNRLGLLVAAREKLEEAVRIKPDGHEALNNWGILLFEQARRANGEETDRLLRQAGAQYNAAPATTPDPQRH